MHTAGTLESITFSEIQIWKNMHVSIEAMKLVSTYLANAFVQHGSSKGPEMNLHFPPLERY